MLCYRCGSHVPDGTEACGTCGQKFALGLKPGPIAGFGTGTRRHRIAVETAPYKVGEVIAGRYSVREHVGAGPVGWIFKCVDLELDVDVALKVVSPRLLQATDERRVLARELKSVRRLSHPNVVRVYEDGEDGERLFFTMQYLEGLSLRRIWDLRRQKGQAFSLKEVEPIVAQIAQALDATHEVTSHGDLKPDNVLVLPDLVKVTDFGLANGLPRAPFMAAQKAGGVHRYLAPEFLHGERIDPRADVFSLGVIVGEMLSGAAFEQPGFDLKARLPNLPPAVDEVFRRATALEAADRYARAGELAKALSDAASGRAAVSVPPPARAEKPAERAPEKVPEKPVEKASEKAPEKSAASIPPPSKAGPAPATPKREITEEIGDDEFEEVEPPPRIETKSSKTPAAVAPVTAKPEQKRPEETRVDKSKAPTPVPPAKTEPKPAEAKPAEAKKSSDQKSSTQNLSEQKSSGKSNAPKVEPKPAKSEPPPAAKNDAKPPAKKGPSANEPAWTGGPAEPPKTVPVPVQPAAAGSNQRIPIAIAVTLLVAIALFLVFQPGADDKPGKDRAPVTPPPATELAVAKTEPLPVETADAGAAGKTEEAALAANGATPTPTATTPVPAAKPSAAEEAKAAAKKALEDAKTEREKKQAEALAKLAEEQAKKEKAAAEKAEQDRLVKAMAEAERLAKERAAERVESERLAKEKAAAEKAEAERLSKEKAAAEKAAAEKAAAEKAMADKAASATSTMAGGSGCPGGMRFIPAGKFKLGAPNSDDMKDTFDLDLEESETGGYCIDVYEAPNRKGIKPTAGVSWKQASDSCRASGKRLCTEEEWERACKGPGGARFPYGKAFDLDSCNASASDTVRTVAFSGVFTKCGSGYGVFDLSGNVAEWTATAVEEGASEKIVKGGAADRPDFAVRCAAREAKGQGTKDKNLGFRCCADPK